MWCCGRNAWNRFNRRQRRKHIKTSPLQQVIKKKKHVSYQRMNREETSKLFIYIKKWLKMIVNEENEKKTH
jgi:hypothetical protein